MSDLERDTYVALGVMLWLFLALALVIFWVWGLSGALAVILGAAAFPAFARLVMRHGARDRARA